MTAPAPGNWPVCVDGRMIGAADGTGVTHYARALHAAAGRISTRSSLLVDSDDTAGGDPHRAAARAVRAVRAVIPFARRARRIEAEGAVRFLAPDVFRIAQVHFDLFGRLLTVRLPGPPGIMHWSYPVPLRVAGWMNLYTVHDAIPLLHPDLTPIDPARHRRLLARIAAAADRIVTVSSRAAADLAEMMGWPAERIVDCSQPVDCHAAAPAGPLPAGLNPRGYLLVCGSVEPRKNLVRLAEAHRLSGTALPLVVAGPDGWRAADIAPAFASPRVVRLPYRTRPQLLALIAGARAVLMPSLAEGFGLPVAEAMTLGTPVMISRDGALAETAGGAALSADARDPVAMADAIARLAGDDALCAALAEAGGQRAQAFRPERFADRLATLYAERLAARLPATYGSAAAGRERV